MFTYASPSALQSLKWVGWINIVTERSLFLLGKLMVEDVMCYTVL